MVINNPYIELVKADSDILHSPEDIYPHKGKWAEYFWNNNPLVLEIGTGMGNFFGKQVWDFPDKNFLGMEIRYKRLYQTAEKSRRNSPSCFAGIPLDEGEQKSLLRRGRCPKDGGSHNFVMLKDFGQNIDSIFTQWEIEETYIFFPDPWANKDRQRKHRLLQETFLQKLYDITKPWGKVFFKTDHREYFDSTKEIIQSLWIWKIIKSTYNYEDSEIFDMKKITEFESFYRGEKTDINYLELAR